MRRLSIALALTIQAYAARAQTPDGAALFQQQCAVCHQPHGQGLAGQFPPLAQNPDIFVSQDFPLRVVLLGLNGKIAVEGQAIDSVMPPLGNTLTDAQIAAVVTPDMVARLRARKDLPPVWSYRESLKAQNGHKP